MKKIILVPDSFKGTMSSSKICSIMESVIKCHFPQAQVISIPVADGGEGSVDCFLKAVGGRKIETTVKGPYFEDMTAFYGILPDNTAVIEMACCAGLPLVGENKHAELTTTYGVGQLMLHAAKSGCKKILMGLGGSSTNDGGTGAAAATGVRFIDKTGKIFIPVGNTLKNIDKIDMSGMETCLKNIEITTMCDIDNPLYGKNGAAYIFAPQKGADADLVRHLDEGLFHMSNTILRCIKKDIKAIAGGGAAGGMGAGMTAFFNSELRMGIEAVLDIVHFDSLIKDADLIISGEGRIDTQSLRGKVVIGVARRAKKAAIPLIAVVGDIGDAILEAYEMGVSSIFSINRCAIPFSEARLRCEGDLEATLDNIMRTLKVTTAL